MKNKMIIAVGITALVCLYYLPVILSGNNLGIQDWDVNFAWNEFVRMSISVYHQFPFWDPYRCGGTAHFANPQMSVLSVQTIFILLFGTVLGLKIGIVFHGILGAVGMYMLAGRYGLGKIGKTLSSVLFSFGGILSSALAAGMLPFANTAYSPWILYWFHRSGTRMRYIIPAALVFAVSFYYDYHVPLLLIVYLTVLSLAEAIACRKSQPLVRLVIFAGISAVCILPKLVLSLQLMSVFPRFLSHDSGYTLPQMLYFLTSWNQSFFRNMDIGNYTFAVDENSLYVGFFPLILFLAYFFRNAGSIRRLIPLLFTLFVLLWLMMGNTVAASAYGALKRLPLYDSFGVAQRFRFLFIIPFTIVAGAGLEHVLFALPARLRHRTAFVCIGIMSADLFLFSHLNFFRQTFVIMDTDSRPPKSEFSQVSRYPAIAPVFSTESFPGRTGIARNFSPNSAEFPALRRNIGTVSCYDAITTGVRVTGADNESYRGEWYTLRGTRRVTLIHWSPQEVTLDLSPANDLVGSDTLVLNQNFYPGWFVLKNGKRTGAIPVEGLLGTPIDATITRVTFTYMPYRSDWPETLRAILHRLTARP